MEKIHRFYVKTWTYCRRTAGRRKYWA